MRQHKDTPVSSIQFNADNSPVRANEGGQPSNFQHLTTNDQRSTLQVRAHEGAQRFIVGGKADSWREVEQLRAEKFQAATDLHSGPGVAGSARGALQAPIPASNLKPTDLITLPGGMDTTVATAERLGYLRKAPGGGYENTVHSVPTTAPRGPEDRAQAREAAPQVAPEATPTPLEDDGSAAVFKLGVSPSLLARGVEEMASTGQMSPDVLREASQQIGAEPAMVQTAMNNAMKAYGQQFETHAAKAGVAPSQFTAWAQSQRADALKLAMVAHVTRQDPRAYNALLAEFKASRR